MNIYHRLVFIILLAVSLCLQADPLLLLLNESEGSQSRRAKASFEKYMAASGCEIKSSTSKQDDFPAFYFSYHPQNVEQIDQNRYELLVQARTYNDYPITSALVIKSSTGITDISSIEGERLGIVSSASYLGWKLMQVHYQRAGIKLDQADVYETGGYEGAMAMLLHGDVFVAVLPGPLVRRWASANKLFVLAESQAQDIGQLWVDKRLSVEQKQRCKIALISLQRTTGRDKRMNVFPDWVEGFR